MRPTPTDRATLSLRALSLATLATTLLAFTLPNAYGEELIAQGSTWRYLDDGSDQGSAWRATDFDDSEWASGAAQLGFGDGDEVTELQRGHITYYFRHSITIEDPGDIAGLALAILRDDGAVVYVNGTEVHRTNMPDGTISHDTFASSNAAENRYYEDEFDASNLTAGTNVIAVEVHQVRSTSSDVSFDFSLNTVAPPGPLVRGPYLQMGTPSSMVVRWRTDGFTDTKLSYGTDPGSLNTTIEIESLTNEHEVLVTGLDSNTRYFYEIGNSETTFAGGDVDHSFKTSPPTGSRAPVRIWVIGDSGRCAVDPYGCDAATAVMDEYLEWVSANGGNTADIILMLGDNAYNDGTDSEYTRGMFEPFATVLRNHVLWPVPGNHEFGASDSPTQSGPYYDAFTLPIAGESGGVASGTEAYYSYDHGNVHFVALDSTDTNRAAPDSPETNICPGDGSGGAMYNWLCEDLAATTQDFIISYWHHPPYTKGSHDSDLREDSGGRMHDMRERFVPMLEYYGADLNFSGHSHSYERSVLIDGLYGLSGTYRSAIHAKDGSNGDPVSGGYTKDQGANQGSIYSVVGSSSGTGGGTFQHPIMTYAENMEGSVVIDIEGTQMDAYFIRNDGAVNDVYRLSKKMVAGDHVPDLVVEVPMVSDNALAAGQAFTFSATVRNMGGRTAPATTLRYYRSTDATLTSGDIAVGNSAVGMLGASSASAESIALTAPASAGIHYYGACVDSVAGESNTTNNCSVATMIAVMASGFTDDPVVAGVTVVKAMHFEELRAGIDALRLGQGLAAFPWTDRRLGPGVTRIRAVHVSELRTALDQVYDAAGRSRPGWTDALRPGMTPVKAAHVNELRRAVEAVSR